MYHKCKKRKKSQVCVTVHEKIRFFIYILFQSILEACIPLTWERKCTNIISLINTVLSVYELLFVKVTICLLWRGDLCWSLLVIILPFFSPCCKKREKEDINMVAVQSCSQRFQYWDWEFDIIVNFRSVSSYQEGNKDKIR